MTKHEQHGFTLIELLITIVIVGVLAAIAYPSYQNSVLKSNRTEGTRTMLETAQTLERCYTTSNTYVGCVPATIVTDNGYYSIAVAAPTASTFTLTATPQGNQTKDGECGTLTLNQAGAKGKSGTASVTDCW